MTSKLKQHRLSAAVERSVHAWAHWLGSGVAMAAALVVIFLWLLSRPLFATTEAWQSAITTPIAILTFLMVFLLQRRERKDSLTLHLKLNEILASQHGASNRLIDLENLSEQEVVLLHQHFQKLAANAKKEENPGAIHSVEEATRVTP